jgi:hypothetical protein
MKMEKLIKIISMKFNYIYFIICLFGISISKMQAQELSVVSGSGLNIKAETIIGAAGLDLTPSSDFSLTSSLSRNTTLSNSTLSLANINKSFKFSETTAAFSGSIRINYQDSELNGLTESNLKLFYNVGTGWFTDNTSTNNASLNYGVSTLTDKPLNELTLGIINRNITKIQDSQCGITLTSLATTISANAVSGASGYRFKVINGATTEIIEAASGSRWFRLTSLPVGTFYNTTYTISVAAKKNNVWGDYGDACEVTTPAFPTTKVQDSQCGVTLASLATTISANPVANASGYRFKVVNGATTEVIEVLNSRSFRLTSLAGGTFYNTIYTISVATKYNGVWGEYGDECTISTPTFPLTKVQDSQCGVTLISLNTTISARSVANAAGYRFKIIYGASTQIIEAVSGSRWFRLTALTDGALYNTTYTISVASKYNGVWGEYGDSCTVTTPAAPLSKLQITQCGITLASDNTTLLYATAVSVAQKYRFEVSLGTEVYTYETTSSSVRSFRMTDVSGLTLARGTTYTVRVAIMANGVWQPYGEPCSITTYSIANVVKIMNIISADFNVVSYPNPFTENFNLNLTSLSEEKVTVMVYDMTGKLLERKEVVPSELSELQVGTNFASGVYNVIVSQGENIKSLRVIKK